MVYIRRLGEWSMIPGVGRGQGGDRYGLPQLTLPCYVRESKSHIKKMLQLVLNWEVSQAAAERTGMICGALWGSKQGQTLHRVSGASQERSD